MNQPENRIIIIRAVCVTISMIFIMVRYSITFFNSLIANTRIFSRNFQSIRMTKWNRLFQQLNYCKSCQQLSIPLLLPLILTFDPFSCWVESHNAYSRRILANQFYEFLYSHTIFCSFYYSLMPTSLVAHYFLSISLS